MTDTRLASIAIPPGFKIVPVTAEDDAILRALERTWEKVRVQDDRIPNVVFEIAPGRESTCTSVGFDQVWPVIQLNLMRDGRKVTGAELLQTLLHQAAHALIYEPGKVRPSEGRYHPRAYRDAGVGLGLDVEASDPVTKAGDGWRQTALARGTLTRYRPEVDRLNRALDHWTATEQPKTERTGSRNGVMLMCSCLPPRKIRIRGNPENIDVSRIRCEICGELFAVSRA